MVRARCRIRLDDHGRISVVGTDISGFVECRAWHRHDDRDDEGGAGWRAAVDLFFLNITRNYDAFGCLFGVRNYANFRPVAAGRGVPADASDVVRVELDRLAQWPDQCFRTTWATWAEVKAVDWSEHAEEADSRLHEFRQTDDGLKFVGKSSWSPRLARAGAAPPSAGEVWTWPEGSEWVVDDSVYRAVRLSRRDAIPTGGEWGPVWTVMAALAELHGDDNVRLVVWFEN